MSDASTPGNTPSPESQIPDFDPAMPHHAQPRLRSSVRGVPMPGQTPEGQQVMMLALTDSQQIADRQVVTNPLAQFFLPHMSGELPIGEIATRAQHAASQQQGVPEQAIALLTEDNAKALVAQLDHAGLLEGPAFDSLVRKMRDDFDASDTLPPGSTAQVADMLVQQAMPEGEQATDEEKAERGPAALREQMDAWMNEVLGNVDDPSFDALPRAIVVPHLDYFRGWINYAHAYGRMRVADRPDRVIVLGTNHFGRGTGVVGCDKGYESPLGTCAYDAEFAGLLEKHLGDEGAQKLYAEKYDHEREHSIELHMPWIQHVFGDAETGACPKVYAALVHDPAQQNGKSYDGAGLDLEPFVEALKAAIAEAPGTTLIVSSADLSHVGKSFGDQEPFAGDSNEATAFREKILRHDREMLDLVQNGKASELVASMAWQQNPTRWCSVGNMVAAMLATEAEQVRILNHTAAGDAQNMAMVTTCAAAIA